MNLFITKMLMLGTSTVFGVIMVNIILKDSSYVLLAFIPQLVYMILAELVYGRDKDIPRLESWEEQ